MTTTRTTGRTGPAVAAQLAASPWPSTRSAVLDGLRRTLRELPLAFLADSPMDDGELTGTPPTVGVAEFPSSVQGKVHTAEDVLAERVLPVMLATLRPRTLFDVGARAPHLSLRLTELAAGGEGLLSRCVVAAEHAPPAQRLAFLVGAARRGIAVSSLVVRPTVELSLPSNAPAPMLVVMWRNLLGSHSTINAIRVLRCVRGAMRRPDRLLLSLDTRSDPGRVEATTEEDRATLCARHAALLSLLDSRFGIASDASWFDSRVHFDRSTRRIETWLVARERCVITVSDGEDIALAPGAVVRTSSHATFERRAIDAMLAGTGLALAEWHTDAHNRAALVVASPAS